MNRDNEAFVGNLDSFKFMKANNVYYLLDDDNIIAALSTHPFKDPYSDNWIITNEVFVDENYRNNNLAVMMYMAIKEIENVGLMSGDKQSESGKRLWNRLSKHTSVRIINLATQEMLPYNDATVANVYTYGQNDYRLIAETKTAFERWSGVKETLDEDRLMEITYHPANFKARWSKNA